MKRLTLLLVVAYATAALGVVVTHAQQASQYNYATTITATNTTGADLSNVAVRVPVNASALVDLGLIASDGQDLLVLSNGAETRITAQMGTSASSWWFPAGSIVNGTSRSFTLYTGQNTPAADNPQYLWLQEASSGTDELVTWPDANPLDVTDKINVRVDNLIVAAFPGTGDATVIRKGSSYEIGVRDGNTIFGRIGSDATLTLNPTANGDLNDIPSESGCSAQGWACVDEGSSHDSDNTFISHNSDTLSFDAYNVEDPADVEWATGVTVAAYAVARNPESTCTGARVQVGVRLSGTNVLGSEQSVTTSYATYSSANLARPGGGNWAVADLNDVQAVVGVQDGGCAANADTRVTSVWLVVTGIASSEVTWASATADTEYDVDLTFDGTTTALLIDGATQATDTASFVHAAPVGTTTLDVGTGAFTGLIDRVRVMDSTGISYEDVISILGDTGSIIPLADAGHEALDATTVTTAVGNANNVATVTYSEARTAFDAGTTDRGGIPGVAFNGTDEEADIPDADYWSRDDSAAEAMSIGLWVNVATNSSGMGLLSKYQSGQEEWRFLMGVGGDTRFSFRTRDRSTAQNILVDSTASVGTNTWKQVLVTYDGSASHSGITLYVDGAAVASSGSTGGSYVAMENGTSVVQLGNIAGAQFYQGQIAGGPCGPFFVQVELTAAQVTDLYNLCSPHVVDGAAETYRTHFDARFEPDQMVETQAGTSGNNWVWQGTITEQSTGTVDGTYTFVRDTTGVTVTLGPVKAINVNAVSSSSETFETFISGDLADPFGSSFDVSGSTYTWPLNVFDNLVGGTNQMPDALFSSLVALVIGFTVALGVFAATRIIGLAAITSALAMSAVILMTPLAPVIILMISLLAVLSLRVIPEPFTSR